MSHCRLNTKIVLCFVLLLTVSVICLTGNFALAARLADMEEKSPAAASEQAPPEAVAPSQQLVPQTVYPAPEAPVPAPSPVAEPEKKDSPEQKTVQTSPEKQATPKEIVKPAPPTAKTKTAAKPKRTPEEKYVTIDFDNVDIAVFIKFISELTGQNFIIDDRVKGKATIISPKKIPIKDVYKVFLSVLEVNGFATVPVGDMVKIVPAVSAREKSLETSLSKDMRSPDDRMVTHIISLERANPDEVKRVLDPIVPKTSSVLSYPPAGMLIITDYLSNVKRLQDIVSALDVEGAGDQISYIPLRNASASEVTKSLSAIYQQRRPTATPIRIVPDARTNSIILLASVSETESLRRLIDLMDKDLPRDESNIQVYRLQYSVAEDLAKVLTSIVKETAATATPTAAGAARPTTAVLSKNIQVVPDKATNTLIIMAEREDYKVLEGIIKQLDVSRPMVYIEALIMEVNANKDFKLGVEWRGMRETTGDLGDIIEGKSGAFIGSGGAGSTGSPGGYNVLDSLVTTVGTSLVGSFPAGFSMGIIGAGIKIGDILFPTIGAVVQAYKTDSEVSILSTPQIMTLNNEEAEINVGSNVPYITRQETSSPTVANTLNYNQYEYRDVGVLLNITPNINEGNFIRLKISQQVTKVVSTGAKEVSTPTTLKRTVKTSVVVKDRETIVIGGLIGDSTQENLYRVPFLGDIPILGWLFKTRSTGREKTNLYVFITPHIVRTQEDASALYKEKKDSMGRVEEGVIKLDEKKPAAAPQSKPLPAAEEIPDKS